VKSEDAGVTKKIPFFYCENPGQEKINVKNIQL
jgi:hypothetical protein